MPAFMDGKGDGFFASHDTDLNVSRAFNGNFSPKGRPINSIGGCICCKKERSLTTCEGKIVSSTKCCSVKRVVGDGLDLHGELAL
jgi:hypothetical protein